MRERIKILLLYNIYTLGISSFLGIIIKYKRLIFDDYTMVENESDLFTLNTFMIPVINDIDLGVDYQVYIKFTTFGEIGDDDDDNDSDSYLEDGDLIHFVKWIELSNICVKTIEDRDYINNYFHHNYCEIEDEINELLIEGYSTTSLEVFLVENKWYLNFRIIRNIICYSLEVKSALLS